MSADDLRKVLDTWAKPPKELVDKLPKGGTTLDYMGHAAVTRALIDVDPEWNWEPVCDDQGIPVIEHRGKRLVMWGRLTVLGKTIVCCGTCEDRKFEPEKELIGDLLRNGAMRFGIGLSLWSKDEWTSLGSSAGSGVSSAPSSPPTARAASSPAAARATSSGHGSPDTGDGPTAGDGPSPADPYIARVNADAELGPIRPGVAPADIVNLIRELDQQTRSDIKEYARSKGYKVTPVSLTQEGADDLAAWLNRRQA